jgi:hypothetical protein
MQMKFHPEKCKVLHLGSNNPNLSYGMTKPDGTAHKLEPVSEEKDLGITIDDKLSFNLHIQQKINKANQTIGAIKHTFKALNPTAFLHLYKGLIRPHLEYASPIWSPRLKRDKDALEKVQRRATRLVQGISDMPYPKRLETLGLPTLEFRRERADIIQCFKLINGHDTAQINRPCTICGNSMLPPTLATNTRGHNKKLQIQSRGVARQNFFTSRVSKPWNNLKQDTVDSPSVNTFKSRLAREWKNKENLYEYRFAY